jgi:hypothetical protein
MNLTISKPIIGSRKRQRGAAAIELALILPVLIVFLTFPIFYASVFWHYTVAQKAAKDAARYLSAVSAQEMRSKKFAPAAAAIASEIAKTEIAELAPGSAIDDPVIECNGVPCKGVTGGALPTTVHVYITFDMYDTFFGVAYTGRYGLKIQSDVTMRYVGH